VRFFNAIWGLLERISKNHKEKHEYA
jgi:hypothetical protein